jgi:2-dehydropantoate 2-reductase
VADADLILLTVKTLDTETAAAALSRHAGPAATVVSLQNGVDNVDRIRSASGIDAVASVIYVAVSMSGPGEVRHQGRGDIVIGNLPGQNRDLGSLSRVFIQGGIPCVISPSIEGELWKKLIVNCAYNAISALVRSQYGRIVADPGTRQTLARAVEETVAVARAAGVELGGEDMVQSAINLGQHMMPGATSSTAQDLERGKQTEIDSLNGYVARRGGELGVRTPVNETLWALVKLLEKSSGN